MVINKRTNLGPQEFNGFTRKSNPDERIKGDKTFAPTSHRRNEKEHAPNFSCYFFPVLHT
jgi:hypothetical protein